MNKTKNDTRIVEHLADIRKSFPRLDAWQDIYPNDTMRQLVADAYLQILEFSRAAVEYFTQFWRKLSTSIRFCVYSAHSLPMQTASISQ